jgi:hypothetical protein
MRYGVHGAYAELVRRPEYRDDKLGTTLEMLPDLLNSDKSTNGHHLYAQARRST